MRQTPASLIAAFCLASTLLAEGPPNPGRPLARSPVRPAAEASPLAQGNTAFACDLYGKLREGQGNLFLSPYSICTALAMTYAGARGQTEKQMAQVLNFRLAQAELHAAFADLQEKINAVQAKQHVQLSVANSLWPQKDYVFLPEFLDLTRKRYGAGLNPVDYKTAAEAARKEINTWVEKKTADKIKDLIKSGMLDAETRLVLVNAIYFKGDWARQFKKERTKEEPFKLAPGKTAPVPLMNQTGTFGYAETDALQVLELAYAGDDLSMVVLLPKNDDGLPTVEAALTPDTLKAWTAALHSREVEVLVPKFKLTCEFELAKTLAALGMPDPFTDRADFSGMSAVKPGLYISKVVHKAFVDVNEEGTEAAAATGVIMRPTAIAMPAEPLVFRADHPFLFLIRHRQSGTVLFLGRVADPRS